MTIIEQPRRTHGEQPGAGYRVVGQSPAHHDFVDKVKGSLLYAADWRLPGMLYGRVVRSQLPSARIVSIDAAAARALPGVAAVLTAADVPHNRVVELASGGLAELEVVMPVLAADRVRYLGEPVAVIAAATQQIADEAAELVSVEYEDLPGVFDVHEALADDAPRVHSAGNTLVTWEIHTGDVTAALAAADVVVEGEYRSQHVEHAYLEPEAGVGWMENGVLTLRVSTQVIEHAATIAEILGLPASKVRVIAAYMGGGFGGKEDMTVEPYLALLVWHTRQPVRMIWDRQESLLASTKRHPFIMRYRTGARSDGTIIAQQVDILGDAGAYPYLSPRVLFAGAALACGPYHAPSASVVARAVFTNNVPASAFRGFGAMQVVFGYESQMDMLAERLGLSRTQVRERNFLAKGDQIPTGEQLSTCVEVEQSMHRALEMLGEPSKPSGPAKRVGRGIGCNRHPYGRTIWFRDRASAWLSLQADGTLLIRTGITDLGAGQAASLCQIAAEVLGVPLDDISIYIGDSALNPPAGGTFATRQLYMSGNAVLNAAMELRERIGAVAAELLAAPAEELVFADGGVSPGQPPDPAGPAAAEPAAASLTLAELVAACDQRSVHASHLSVWRAEAGTFDPRTGQGDSFPDYTYGTHAAEVEVDVETGEVTVLRYAACHDVGRAINPMRVEGQIQGGAMQGLGYALTEDIMVEDGYVQSTLFANYLIPNALDFPDVQVGIIESGEGKGPLGARGIGEPPIGNVAATIASAIHDAIGVRPTQLPMTPERVLALLDEQARAEPQESR
ncbi:MAG TPA: xanthine dehydrogenase family protein molybdopterin-binding subunit [Streptosporangiaceae bacterium]|nr:xanthine dehydrogenase family protein molybdopterin-binding subunit [Streptosporangiaceae bacterium]